METTPTPENAPTAAERELIAKLREWKWGNAPESDCVGWVRAHAALAVAEATKELREQSLSWRRLLETSTTDLATAQRQKQEFAERASETTTQLKETQRQLAVAQRDNEQGVIALLNHREQLHAAVKLNDHKERQLIRASADIVDLRAQLAAAQAALSACHADIERRKAAEKRLRDGVTALVTDLSDRMKWNWTRATDWDNAAETFLVLMTECGLTKREGHRKYNVIDAALAPSAGVDQLRKDVAELHEIREVVAGGGGETADRFTLHSPPDGHFVGGEYVPASRAAEGETPRTDEVLRIADNWVPIHDAAGGVEDGVTPQEAHDDMVASLTRLARTLERELAAANGRAEQFRLERDGYYDGSIALRAERDDLARWKREALTVESWWAKIDEFVRKSPRATLGRSVAAMALEWLVEADALREDKARHTAFLAMLQTDFHATPFWQDGVWQIARLMDPPGQKVAGVVCDRYESFTAAIDVARKTWEAK